MSLDADRAHGEYVRDGNVPLTPPAQGSRSRDALAVVVWGCLIAAAPAAWYPRVWPRAGDAGWGLFGFACSVAPFALLAYLRDRRGMRRGATALAAVICAALVVLGQVAGLDPNDPSSTAPIALVTLPMFAALVVGSLYAADTALMTLVENWRRRWRGHGR